MRYDKYRLSRFIELREYLKDLVARLLVDRTRGFICKKESR